MSLYRKIENYMKTNTKEGKPDSESIMKAINYVFENYAVNKMSNQELEDLITEKAISFYSDKYHLNIEEYAWDKINLDNLHIIN